MGTEPTNPVDEYDAKHGKPEATPAAPNLTPDEAWGENLNHVRETPLAGTGLKSVGK